MPGDEILQDATDFNQFLVENPAATFAVGVAGESMTGAPAKRFLTASRNFLDQLIHRGGDPLATADLGDALLATQAI